MSVITNSDFWIKGAACMTVATLTALQMSTPLISTMALGLIQASRGFVEDLAKNNKTTKFSAQVLYTLLPFVFSYFVLQVHYIATLIIGGLYSGIGWINLDFLKPTVPPVPPSPLPPVVSERKKQENLLDFYENDAPNLHGDTFESILAFNDDALERKHDYVQWLFPNSRGSGPNKQAPAFTDRDLIQRFKASPTIQENCLRATGRMMEFYGFTLSCTRDTDGNITEEKVERAENFEGRRKNLYENGHNDLRITRMLIFQRKYMLHGNAIALAWATALGEMTLEFKEESVGGKRVSKALHDFWGPIGRGKQPRRPEFRIF